MKNIEIIIEFKKVDLGIIDSFETEISSLRNLIDNQKLDESLKEIWIKISKSNKYIDEQAPWKLRKTEPERMQTVLFTLLETIRCIGIVLQPVMPASANEILNQLTIDPSDRSFSALNEEHCVQSGAKLQQPNPIFPRFDEKT